jgi:tRNA(fMet)-specific endonuclease VapC
MASVVVDTDVVSFVLRRDSRRTLYRPHLNGRTLVVSFMTVAELEHWAAKHQWGAARRAELEDYLSRCVVQHSTAALCRRWAAVMTVAEQAGRPMTGADAWQAATALHYDVALVIHNRRHFLEVPGLTVISEAPGS